MFDHYYCVSISYGCVQTLPLLYHYNLVVQETLPNSKLNLPPAAATGSLRQEETCGQEQQECLRRGEATNHGGEGA